MRERRKESNMVSITVTSHTHTHSLHVTLCEYMYLNKEHFCPIILTSKYSTVAVVALLYVR